MPVEEEGIAWNKDWAIVFWLIKNEKLSESKRDKNIENRFIDMLDLIIKI